MKQKSVVAKKFPTEENAQQGIERILVPDAIETNSTGKNAECCALEFVVKVGWWTPRSGTLVQRDRERLCGSTGERGVPRRRRAKKLRVRHFKTQGHAADR